MGKKKNPKIHYIQRHVEESSRNHEFFVHTFSHDQPKNVKRKKLTDSFSIRIRLIKNAENRGNERQKTAECQRATSGKAYLPLNAFPRPPITDAIVDGSRENLQNFNPFLSTFAVRLKFFLKVGLLSD